MYNVVNVEIVGNERMSELKKANDNLELEAKPLH